MAPCDFLFRLELYDLAELKVEGDGNCQVLLQICTLFLYFMLYLSLLACILYTVPSIVRSILPHH